MMRPFVNCVDIISFRAGVAERVPVEISLRMAGLQGKVKHVHGQGTTQRVRMV
jgi:hypothetical protein